MNLDKNIRALRLAKGMTLEEVGSVFGIKRASVAGWESGDTRPDIEKLVRLAKLFSVTVDFLLTGDAARGTPKQQIVDWPFSFSHSKFEALPPNLQGKIDGFASGIISEWESRTDERRAG